MSDIFDALIQPENHVLDAEILVLDARVDRLARTPAGGARVRAAEELLCRRRAQFDTAFLAALGITG